MSAWVNRILTPEERPSMASCFPGNHSDIAYGDICPAWMLPEHHPDHRPVPKPNLKRSATPGSKPFDWRKDVARCQAWRRNVAAAFAKEVKRLAAGYVEVSGPGRYDYERIPYPGLTRADRETYTTQEGTDGNQ